MRVGYFLSFSISFILLVACFLLVHVQVPVVPAVTCSLIFLSSTGIAYQRFNLFKISSAGGEGSTGVESISPRGRPKSISPRGRPTDFKKVLAMGEMLHRARALGNDAYNAAKRQFLQEAYNLMDGGMEPLALEVCLILSYMDIIHYITCMTLYIYMNRS